MSVIFALSTTFMHVGKGVCVALVILQVPGASGLYPIEMMPAFFRAIYPLLPFTYSIDAMRETIGGFYDGLWSSISANCWFSRFWPLRLASAPGRNWPISTACSRGKSRKAT